MGLIIRKKASKKELQEISERFSGYIKVVVDIKRKTLAGGGDRHADDEKILLEDGSKQRDLWGGGFDLETKEVDYNSIINLRPRNKESKDFWKVRLNISKRLIKSHNTLPLVELMKVFCNNTRNSRKKD